MTASTSSPTLRKGFLNLPDVFKDLSPENPVGPYLRYDPVYDDIRLARIEDDPRLSMGIWKTELKRADWNLVENLCIETLTTRSKDLQLGAWLTEAWTALDGVEGYVRGIQLLTTLTETFWKVIHPQPQEDDDMESRLMIFEWMDTVFSDRLLLVPLTKSKLDQTTFGLGFYKSAQHSDATQKRLSPNNAPSQVDPSKTIGTLEDFQRSIDQTSDAYLSTQLASVLEATQASQTYKTSLAGLLGNTSPSFSRIIRTLKEMERILTNNLQTRVPPTPEPTPEPEFPREEPIEEIEEPELIEEEVAEEEAAEEEVDEPAPEEEPENEVVIPEQIEEAPAKSVQIKTREDAYRQLELIATFLEEHDPQSFAPRLLRQVIGWENENILDILKEIAKTPKEYEILMKFLARSPKE
ncbi:MAG: type VI secretion system protein TssA [Alphaproteobacteria bacterium]|jgi:type VI secretion system protein ImpA|nr:type VI secretion system protein TssA [Alphaproteobacteria bacterium]